MLCKEEENNYLMGFLVFIISVFEINVVVDDFNRNNYNVIIRFGSKILVRNIEILIIILMYIYMKN